MLALKLVLLLALPHPELLGRSVAESATLEDIAAEVLWLRLLVSHTVIEGKMLILGQGLTDRGRDRESSGEDVLDRVLRALKIVLALALEYPVA